MRTAIAAPSFLVMAWMPLSALEHHQEAPPPPAVVTASAPSQVTAPGARLASNQYIDFGSPSNDEQYYLELINRARTNPPAEGTRLKTTTDPDITGAYTYFGVDLNLMESEFAAIAAAQPLVFNAKLIAAARGHSDWMKTNDTQSHNEGAATFDQRITAQGYTWNTAGENIYAYAKTVPYGHAGFEVDWGSGTGGMQAGRGHRVNIHNNAFREIGIGVSYDSSGATAVGPSLVTQDFASRNGLTPFITGVVFTDGDGDLFYDPGEGRGGIRVDIAGVGTADPTFYAITGTSGGYAVPVPGNGTYQVTFTNTATSQVVGTATATVSGGLNKKVDFQGAVTNAAPTITSIANQTLAVGGTTSALAFTVGDAETAAASLVVTRASSNTVLVPLANVVLGGSGASRTVTATAAAGQTGTSTITLTVADANGGTASTTFTVTVANTAPTISAIADLGIPASTSTSALAFTIGDAETPGSLTLGKASSNTTLVPLSGIVFGGSGASRTVTVTPAAGLSGTAQITITVTDPGSLSASEPFTLTVTASGGDTTPPTTPSAPSVANGTTTTPTFSGATEAGATVHVYDGGAEIGTATANGSGAWTFTPSTPLTGGGHTITVRAQDAAGNLSGLSAGTAITVDATPPSTPAAPTLANGTTATPTLSGGTEANATVRVFDNGTLIGTATANGSGAWTFTPTSPLAAGVHVFTVVAVDGSGNASAASSGTTTTIGVIGGGGSSSGGGGGGGGCGLGSGLGAAGFAGLLLLRLRPGRRRR